MFRINEECFAVNRQQLFLTGKQPFQPFHLCFYNHTNHVSFRSLPYKSFTRSAFWAIAPMPDVVRLFIVAAHTPLNVSLPFYRYRFIIPLPNSHPFYPLNMPHQHHINDHTDTTVKAIAIPADMVVGAFAVLLQSDLPYSVESADTETSMLHLQLYPERSLRLHAQAVDNLEVLLADYEHFRFGSTEDEDA